MTFVLLSFTIIKSLLLFYHFVLKERSDAHKIIIFLISKINNKGKKDKFLLCLYKILSSNAINIFKTTTEMLLHIELHIVFYN